MGAPETRLDRRLVLTSALGVATLAACGGKSGGPRAKASGSASASASSSGPIIREQEGGTVISTDDMTALVKQLDAAVNRHDVAAMQKVVPGLKVGQWRTRLARMAQFPLTDVGFVFQDTSDKASNASGGAVKVEVEVGMTHRIAGCDARTITQPYTATLTKESPDAPVRVLELDGPGSYTIGGPVLMHWDVAGDWHSLSSPHVLLFAHTADLGWARANLAKIEAGAVRAMRTIPPASGIRRLCMTVAKPNSDLFGGRDSADAAGFAMRLPYVDPDELAKTGVGEANLAGKLGGTRIVLHRDAIGGRVESVACHESIHALAQKWGGEPEAPWMLEGLAEWVENGFAAGLRRSYDAGLIRSDMSGFRQRMKGSNRYSFELFHDGAHELANYACAAGIYAMLEETESRKAALDFARRMYAGDYGPVTGEEFGAQLDALYGRAITWSRSV